MCRPESKKKLAFLGQLSCPRIPVLYGPVSQLSDSAVTVLLDLVRKGVPAAVSSYEVEGSLS